MSRVEIHMCPETGICSLLKANGEKVDLAPDDVDELREASGNPQAIKGVIADFDKNFSEQLDDADLQFLSDKIK